MIRLKKGERIYSRYEISVILFAMTMLWLMPLILVFTYVFSFDLRLNIDTFLFFTILFVFVVAIVGSIVLRLSKDKLKRQVKPAYLSEYVYLLFITAFGLLGFVVFYDYLGGNRQYIANILIVLFAGFVYLLLRLGRAFFKIDYMKKK
jgi:hypothetical protein